jgi:hypothetical protein
VNIRELKDSSERIGKFYPILVDYYGNIIDGEHRLKASEDWKRIKLDHIKTEKELLVGRLICNNLRRTASVKEKTALLARLGDIYLNEGTPIGKIVYELSYHTGMSYRWVAKYLPERLKDSIHASASKKKRKKVVACFATKSIVLKDPPNNALKIAAYSNTSFVNFVMKKKLYEALEKKAEELETNVEYLVYNAIRLILNGSATE